jgi:16S rRNA (adenine1518-N6/adenine1519-N6)-dimethyltransferase
MYTLKKSLGQHFLKDENICRKIVESLQKNSFEQLLEVGPGAGALTKHLLLLKEINLKAVELDEEKIIYLLQTYPDLKDKIIHQSVLEMEKPFERKFAVVGNFPYNISTEIIFQLMDWKEDIDCVVGMFQKEVSLSLS